MAKLTLAEITADYGSKALFNDNFALIESAIENTLSRDGTTPNTMGADLDMNSNRINNLPDPINNSEPVTLGYGEAQWGTASAYADAAAASAAAAAASEAATAADAIATAADAVSTAADAASTAADAIATAADRVQTGLDAAATAADVVSTNADVVSTNADAAATAADAAATAADAISTAADAAATAADVVTVAGIYDSFDDRYLGAKASDPALDNDGNALLTGALYFNTTSSEMRVWSGSAWLTSYVPSSDFVAKTGDTMSGDLSIAKTNPDLVLDATADSTHPRITMDAGSALGEKWDVLLDNTANKLCVRSWDSGSVYAYYCFNSSGTPSATNEVAPKSYVDDQDALQVTKTGDTMTGALSLDMTNPNIQYHSDYVGVGSHWDTIGLASNGNLSVRCWDLADTGIENQFNFYPTGMFYAPDQIRVGATAPSAISDLTRKDYVDTQVSTKVSVAGDTMTGALNLVMAYPNIQFYGDYSGQGSRWDIIDYDSNGDFAIRCYNAAESAIAYTFRFQADGHILAPNQVRATASAPSAINDLTRKDYVDTQVSTKVSVAGDTMTGDLSIDKSYPSVQYYNGVYSGQGSRWATIILDASGDFAIQCYDAAETSIAKTWIFYPNGDFWGGGQVRSGASAPVDDYDLTRKDYVDKLLAFSPQFTLVTGADDVFPLLEYAQFGFTIDKAYYKTDSGTITAEVAINGTAVTGLSALSLTSTQGNSTATAANTVAVGDKVAITLSSNSSADTVSICLHCTRT